MEIGQALRVDANVGCSIPAGFNVEKVEHKNVAFTVWDVGGQDKLRPLWRQYLSNSDALVSSEFRACHQCACEL